MVEDEHRKVNKSKEFSILPIFLVVLIDMIGIGIIIPVLGPLFLSTNIIFGSEVAFATRAITLGFLIASYALAQFFGAPILGALSDKHGRKKLLIISLAGTVIGYLLFAVGILTHNIYILFFSRIIDGFTGGNITIAMSSIADVSDERTKVKRFGLVGMSFGLGMIVGPVVGGYLSSSSVVSWFNFATPFFFAAGLAFVNILLFMFNFKETLHTKKHSEISLLTGFKHIKKAFGYEELRVMFIFVFLLTFGFSFFTQFFQVFLIEKFSYTGAQIGTLFGFMGLCIAIGQGFIVRPLSKKFCPQEILPVSVLFMSLAIAFMLVPKHASGLFFIIPVMAISNGLTLPNMNALISNLTARENQGEVMGVSQSIQSLAMAIPPLIAGAFAAIHYVLPVVVGSVTIFCAWLVFIIFFKQRHRMKCALR